MPWGAPFEAASFVWGAGQGRLVVSALGFEEATILVMARLMVVRMRHLFARGRGATHQMSSLKTSLCAPVV